MIGQWQAGGMKIIIPAKAGTNRALLLAANILVK
jgi:hypothetical protein